jgi:pyruvate dehydrogenase E2 component (dihydrolipoamide acetyltransferase)
MPTEIKLPELGENVAKGDVVRVLVSVGDTIKKDQPLLELETDKATIEVPSNVAGTVTAVNVKPGEKVKVGQVVLELAAEGAAAPAAAAPAAAAPAKAGPAQPTAAEPPAEAKPVEAPRSAQKPASVVDISSGRHVASSRPDGALPGAAASSAAVMPEADQASPVPAAPSVRRFARELGIDIAHVPGTGPGGRIGQEDVKQHVKSIVTSPRGGGGAPIAPLPGL